MKLIHVALLSVSMTLAAGCASTLSGVGGHEGYACKAPEGVLCTSIAGVYSNSVQNNLPSQRVEKRSADPVPPPATMKRTAPIAGSATDGGSIRSAPRILRVWIAPWEDSDGDLQDQSHVYVVVDSGRWLIEHRRAAIRNAFMPIMAPTPAPPLPSNAGSAPEGEPASLSQPVAPFSPQMRAPAPNESKQDVE